MILFRAETFSPVSIGESLKVSGEIGDSDMDGSMTNNLLIELTMQAECFE
jgi:hypothetical protein